MPVRECGVAAMNVKRTLLAVGVTLGALGSLGSTCTPQRHPAVSLAPVEGRRAWDTVVNDWSREHRVYNWSDDLIYARATYHAPAFRKGFIDHASHFYGDFSKVAKKELVDLGGGEAEFWHSFFVSAYVGTQKYKALAHGGTIWTLSLENDQGVRVVAEKLTDVRYSPAVKSIYPYTDRFDRAYLVRFPLADKDGKPIISATTRQFKLHISSAYAEATLIWDLAPGSGVAENFGMPRDAGPVQDAGKEKDDEGMGGLGKIFGN